jgi:hypothetical protein
MERSGNLNWFEFLFSRISAGSVGSFLSRHGTGPELYTADFVSSPPTITNGALDGWERAVVS